MSDLYKIATTEELAEEGSRIITEIEGQEIAVFNIYGEYYAIANYCVHQSGPLCEGKLTGNITVVEDDWNWALENEGRIIVCPWHSWRFDVTTGEHIQDPDRYSVPSYEVTVKDDDIYVSSSSGSRGRSQ